MACASRGDGGMAKVPSLEGRKEGISDRRAFFFSFLLGFLSLSVSWLSSREGKDEGWSTISTSWLTRCANKQQEYQDKQEHQGLSLASLRVERVVAQGYWSVVEWWDGGVMREDGELQQRGW